jgi:hypothetical protein
MVSIHGPDVSEFDFLAYSCPPLITNPGTAPGDRWLFFVADFYSVFSFFCRCAKVRINNTERNTNVLI